MVQDLEGLVEFLDEPRCLDFEGGVDCRLRICRVLGSRMEIEKRFAMTKACQDILYVSDIKRSESHYHCQIGRAHV